MKVLEMWNDLWIGDGTLYAHEVELAFNIRTMANSDNRPFVVVGISTPCGQVSTGMISVFISGRVCTQEKEFELTRLTCTRLKDNLMRHRGDRCVLTSVPLAASVRYSARHALAGS